MSDPAVHQLLEIWAGNMTREMNRQTEISRDLLCTKVKEAVMSLGGQGS